MGGSQFPERDLVIFLTFCVILTTVVGQGLRLTPLIKLLHLREAGSREREHSLAHMAAAHAAKDRLNELAEEEWVPEEDLTRLRSKYEDKIESFTTLKDDNGVRDERDGDRPAAKRRLHQELLKAERNAIIHLRDQGRIDDEVL